MIEPVNINRDQLLKDYAAIIDKQTEDILRLKCVRDKMLQEFYEIEQILGKALGYPWLKDDQITFPLATEKDGVTIGAETACSLAMQASDKIKELKERNEKLSKRHPTTEEAIAQYHWLKANSKRNK
jgi:hypothetical protein